MMYVRAISLVVEPNFCWTSATRWSYSSCDMPAGLTAGDPPLPDPPTAPISNPTVLRVSTGKIATFAFFAALINSSSLSRLSIPDCVIPLEK